MSSGISSKPEQAGHGSPFVSFSAVFSDFFLPDNLPDKMDTSDVEKETFSVRKGDVFLTRTSETIDELGMSSVAVKDYPGATFSGFLKRLRPKNLDLVYEKYIAFYLRSGLFRKTMNNNAIMTLRASLNEQIFSYLEVVLPELPEQKKIGDFLYLLNSKICLNKRINAELEALAKTIYDYWFVQFDFPDENGRPYKSSGGKMVWNDALKRDIPAGWTDGVLSSIAKITMGQSPPGESYNEKGNGLPFFQGCTDFGVRFPNVRQYTYMPSRIADPGDILLSVRAPVGSLNIANERCCIGRGLAALKSNNGYTAYLWGILRHLAMVFERRNADGTTFGAITKDDLYSLAIVKPSEQVLKQFQKLVKPSFEVQNKIELENRELVALRDWLLPMLMNGQVKIQLTQ